MGLLLAAAMLPVAAQSGQSPAPVELDLDQSLSTDQGEHEPGFLYLKEPRVVVTPGRQAEAAPRAALAESVFENVQGGTVDLVYLPRGATELRQGFAVSLSSHSFEEPALAFGAAGPGGLPLQVGSRQVGVSLGYWGFNLGAALRTDQLFLDGRVDGVDVGLGYQIGGFATNVSVGEYHRDKAEAGFLSAYFDSFYKMELGASYRVNRLVQFSGGVQYLDFRNVFLEEPGDAQKLFLRGSFTF